MTSLAALILYDSGADISADNILTLLAVSNNAVAPYWPNLFAGLIRNTNMDFFIISASDIQVPVTPGPI